MLLFIKVFQFKASKTGFDLLSKKGLKNKYLVFIASIVEGKLYQVQIMKWLTSQTYEGVQNRLPKIIKFGSTSANYFANEINILT